MRAMGDDEPPGGGHGIPTAAELRTHLFAGLSACSPEAAAVAESLVRLSTASGDAAGAEAPGASGLGAAAVVADDLLLLARLSHLLDAETGLRAAAADRIDATATGARSTLRAAGCSRTRASAILGAGRLAAERSELQGMWRTGRVDCSQLATLAARTTALDEEQQATVVDTLTPYLPVLNTRETRSLADAAVDALRPEAAQERERFAYNRRYLTHSVYAENVLIEARMPLLEGRALLAAVDAHAEKLRTEGDRLTKAQRRADGLANLVATAAASGTTPATGGLPAAVTVTIPLSVAERLTGGTNCASGTDCASPGSDSPVMPYGRIGRDGTLGAATARFLTCCAGLSGVVVTHPHGTSGLAALLGAAQEEPLAVGRTQRLATTAQRKALAVRDGGCVIPGCAVEAHQCQPHHVRDWAAGGGTDMANLALLCWSHHRQVDMGRWLLRRNPGPAGPYWSVQRTPRSSWRPRRQ